MTEGFASSPSEGVHRLSSMCELSILKFDCFPSFGFFLLSGIFTAYFVSCTFSSQFPAFFGSWVEKQGESDEWALMYGLFLRLFCFIHAHVVQKKVFISVREKA